MSTHPSKSSPFDGANIFSKSSFWWMNPIFDLAKKTPITADDIFQSPKDEEASRNTKMLERRWNDQRTKQNPSFFYAMLRAFWRPFFYSGLSLILEAFLFLHYLWIGPLQILLVFWMMSKITVIPSLCSICVLVFFIPVQLYVHNIYGKIRMATAKITDERIRILTDIIGGIRVIKVHAWEAVFTKIVRQIRSLETRFHWRSRICLAFEVTQLVYQIRLAMMALLLAVVLGHDGSGDPLILRSYNIFTLFNYISALFISVTLFLPLSIQNLFDTRVSCQRIMSFLLIPELQDDRKPTILDSNEPSVQFIEVEAQWGKCGTKSVLNGISFDIRGPQLIAIVGSVGAGKSSLLQAILGELPVSKGFVFRSNKIAYAPQLAWIFAGTIRENVLCDLPYDEERYKAVLKVTTLDVDLANLPMADQTQVGERGISMSGGQKARIGLARVAYSQANFVLLDDPLAAVDARVTHHLFDVCICDYLSDRLRLLVTHQHHLLPKMDKIIVMKEGKMQFFGTYDEMISQGIDMFESITGPPSPVTLTRTSSVRTTSFTESMKPMQLLEHRQMSVSEDENPQERLDKLWNSLNPNTEFVDEVEKPMINEQEFNEDCHEVQYARAAHHLDKSLPKYPKSRSRSECSQSNEMKSNHSILSRQTSKSQNRPAFNYLDSVATSVYETPRHSIASSVMVGFENIPNTNFDEPNDDEDTKPTCTKNGQLVKDDQEHPSMEYRENWNRGAVAMRNYVILAKLGGGLFGLVATLVLFGISMANACLCDVWLSKWSSMVDYRVLTNQTVSANSTNFWDFENSHFNVYVYCGLAIALVMFTTIRSLSFFALLLNSAKILHERMLWACLSTRIKFFEINPSGRIINRFSKDIGMIDELLPQTIHDFLQCFCVVLGFSTVTFISSYWVMLPTIPLLVAFWFIRKHYLMTSRDLKRIETVARSPIYSSVNVTLQGLPCIRASCSESTQLMKFYQLTDTHTNVFLMTIAANHWLSIRLDLLCLLFIISVVVVCILLGIYSSIPGATVALMITYANNMIGLFQWCVRVSAEVENQMVSAERAVEYMDLEPEQTNQMEIEEPNPSWPDRGRIRFENFWLRYHVGGSWALKGINLEIKPKCKVGIVGRTGAGKSSLISAIFRLVESDRGTILIDGIDIQKLNLQELRKRISIIPQDPIMFTGTIRTNLDPDEIHSDEAIWKALSAVQLRKMISDLEDGLQAQINEGGSNFSTGQRQLLALARAILGGNRILVVDEATANVDPATDSVIQQTLRNKFNQCTVLTVAHRLHTVIDNDMIVVMENGGIVEVGTPHELLNPEQAQTDAQFDSSTEKHSPNLIESNLEPVSGKGPLANLVRQTGTEEARFLAQMARNSFLSMVNKRKSK